MSIEHSTTIKCDGECLDGVWHAPKHVSPDDMRMATAIIYAWVCIDGNDYCPACAARRKETTS